MLTLMFKIKINKQDEIGTYQNISIIENLAGSIFLSMVAQEVILQPNIKPLRQTFFRIPIPGHKVKFNN